MHNEEIHWRRSAQLENKYLTHLDSILTHLYSKITPPSSIFTHWNSVVLYFYSVLLFLYSIELRSTSHLDALFRSVFIKQIDFLDLL